MALAPQVLAGVGPGDEVITSTFSFSAVPNSIIYTGAQPTFIDSGRKDWNFDAALFKAELERRAAAGEAQPKAILPVDIYGVVCDYDEILPLCKEYGIIVVEDATEALGSTYNGKAAGTFGEYGAFSFNGNKIITTVGTVLCVARRVWGR